MDNRVFIEEQFPISKISKESYKERKGVQSQTLTSLGKWWGRKPLIIVRAVIIGLLMPVSNDPAKDRDVFLKILTMDEEGLWLRRSKTLPPKIIEEYLTEEEWTELNQDRNGVIKRSWSLGLTQEEKVKVYKKVFSRLSYDEKLNFCDRPEQIDGPSENAWREINAHLGTSASNIQELIKELGIRKLGHVPSVGDAFCGGGSIPFEASRIGCESYGSDINPVAALLSWASLNIVGGGKEAIAKTNEAMEATFSYADKQITKWGIEHNAKGWRADAYLYCTEVSCPSCNIIIPLAPSWLIGPTSKVVANLHQNKNRFDIVIIENASDEQIEYAREAGTLSNGRILCPACKIDHSISSLKHASKEGHNNLNYGLRLWEKDDIVPRENDIYNDRLYCIRWVETYWKKNPQGKLVEKRRRHYRSITDNDIKREKKVLTLLRERFSSWQKNGVIPSKEIPRKGEKTEEPIRTRGWTYWHHMFTPRQLLTHGLISEHFEGGEFNIGVLLGLAKIADWDSKLCRWGVGAARESIAQTFYNQAFNPFFNYAGKGLTLLKGTFFLSFPDIPPITTSHYIDLKDARAINTNNDFWITDPPYADAINYHELTEFFLVWYNKHLSKVFPQWYTDTKSSLAVKGTGIDFKQSMVEIYQRLANNMTTDGMQVVMFTHQDSSVWADLSMILWAAGLKVTAAWTIATETTTGIKKGNYVQGTVLLILKKRLENETAFLDELYPEIEDEVRHQLDHMLELDDKDDPNFVDTDYQLAAYAAALRVLTQYSEIEGHDIKHELFRDRQAGEKSAFEQVIDRAVEIASDHLVPVGLERRHWKILSAPERLYLKGLELEKHMEARSGAYQELAKGFGVRDYTFLYAKTKANEVRFKTGSEFQKTGLGGGDFGNSLVRNMLFAIHETVRTEDARQGLNWLRAEILTYWDQRKLIIEIFKYLSNLAHIPHMPHWDKDADAAQRLAGAVENDHAGTLL